MPTAEETREKLVVALLDSFKKEYEYALDTWKTLEAKAQVSITLSGIFLAATFAFARDLSRSSHAAQILLALAIIALVAAAMLALIVYRVGLLQAPPLGTFLSSGTRAVLGVADDDLPDYVRRLADSQVEPWLVAVEEINNANARKATLVAASQSALVAATVATSVFTMIQVLR